MAICSGKIGICSGKIGIYSGKIAICSGNMATYTAKIMDNDGYPLVNAYIRMENQYVYWVNHSNFSGHFQELFLNT